MVTIRCKDATFTNIQAVIFDKDGTLANSELFLRNLAHRRSRLIDAQIPGVQEPLLMAFGVEGDRINPAGMMAVGSRRDSEIAAAAYIAETGRDWIEALNMAHSAFIEADRSMPRKADHTPFFEAGRELLQTLTAAGLKLGILSADTTPGVKDFSDRYQLEPYFQLQMGSDEGYSKPDPALLQEACRRLAVKPEATLVVGDSQADIQMARAANVAGCIGVTWGWTSPFALEADVLAGLFSDIQIAIAQTPVQ
ncbi:HAD family hydrolase [Leptolyngbya sp. FACHB-541]|uniref:HAD family hydrolase n=1 Tax=Leptolyngbya sp. FACHB-541 TaxID=2692810 RepID=UPI0016878369|nr:HAD family hydrolase [Leptolyngbya sp. FACHB-541]MBD1998893.1 HAD family hydrolase [Leptolyngbya sp. FACHB-541]